VRRIALLGVVALGLALLALTVHSRSPARAKSAARVVPVRVAHAPTATVAGGSTCYVGVADCSERPCVVFVGASSAAVYILPGIQRPQPAGRCPAGSRRVNPVAPSTVGASVPRTLGQLAHQLAGQLAHRLSRRP
jgi:hypothetical protein